MMVRCSKCGDCFEVPDELIGDSPLDESEIYCGQCDPDEYPDLCDDGETSFAGYYEEDEAEACPFCGKDFEDWSDAGCAYCDPRV